MTATVNGQVDVSTPVLHSLAIRGPRPWIDVEAYGASPTATAAANVTAIQAAVTAGISAGGARIYLPRQYHINAPITVNPGSGVQLEIIGSGRYTSGLIQDTAATDSLVIGASEAAGYAYYQAVRGLSISGGRYPLRLNNVVASRFEDLLLTSGTVGLYGEGQLERNTYLDIDSTLHSSFGISLGNTNGGVAVGVNFPIFAKSIFDNILVSGCTGTAAVKLTAAVYDAVQQTSGPATFKHLRLEENTKDGVDLSYCDMVEFNHLTAEKAGTLDAANTYVQVKVGTGCGVVTLRECNLPGRSNGATTYKHCVYSTDGIVEIDGGKFTAVGDAGTSAIQIDGISGHIRGAIVPSANHLLFANATVRGKSSIHHVTDSSGVPLVGWPLNTPVVSGSANGLEVGNLVVGSGQTKIVTFRGSLAASATLDLGASRLGRVRIADSASGAVAEADLRGSGNTTNEVSDPVGILEITDIGTAWAIYWSGATYLLKNRTAALRGYVVVVEDLA